MNKDTKCDYALIAAYLAGETTAAEEAKLHEFRNASPQNEAEFQEAVSLWTLAGKAPEADPAQAEILWKKAGENKNRPSFYLRRIAAAAAFFCLLGLSWLAGSRFSSSAGTDEFTVRTNPGQHSEIVLPDGSHVWLNSSSSLSYSSAFSGSRRNVRLTEGQAVFQIVKDPANPFTVECEDIDIRVYGTTFDVRTYKTEHDVEVALQEGSVEVFGKDGASMALMVPGELFTFDKSTGAASIETADIAGRGIWRQPELKLQNCSLAEVVTLMEEWYGVKINIEGKSSSGDQYWMTIKTESLREMLDLMSRITPMTYEINGDSVNLKLQ
ncbi:MAG: FecR domain-containing protein [Bacteroidales bacterium]|nr:FecR domain-containing protein [Bacteroidales bacterium]